jgi:hypothetical protein
LNKKKEQCFNTNCFNKLCGLSRQIVSQKSFDLHMYIDNEKLCNKRRFSPIRVISGGAGFTVLTRPGYGIVTSFINQQM